MGRVANHNFQLTDNERVGGQKKKQVNSDTGTVVEGPGHFSDRSGHELCASIPEIEYYHNSVS